MSEAKGLFDDVVEGFLLIDKPTSPAASLKNSPPRKPVPAPKGSAAGAGAGGAKPKAGEPRPKSPAAKRPAGGTAPAKTAAKQDSKRKPGLSYPPTVL